MDSFGVQERRGRVVALQHGEALKQLPRLRLAQRERRLGLLKARLEGDAASARLDAHLGLAHR